MSLHEIPSDTKYLSISIMDNYTSMIHGTIYGGAEAQAAGLLQWPGGQSLAKTTVETYGDVMGFRISDI